MHTVITHSGSFHADDVFAVASLQLLLGKENVEVIRTRDEAVIAAGEYVVDVGGVYDAALKRFDHHQPGAPVRENGIPYAAFGLVWKHYGEAIAGSAAVADKIEDKLCVPIDASDNAISVWQPGQFDLAPLEWDDIVKTWKVGAETDEALDEQFMNVTTFAREYLQRIIQKEQLKQVDQARAAQLYAAAERDTRIIVSDEPVSRRWFIEKGDVDVVVHPRTDGKWMAITVEKDKHTYDTKVSFPQAWRGLRENELASVSGIADAFFCHKTGYLFVADSKESAVSAAQQAK